MGLIHETTTRFAVDGQRVVGTLCLPPGGPAPVVLLFHGFTGSRHEMPVAGTREGVFSRTARLLAQSGYASLRIDFRGNGDSDGDFADTTYDAQIADATEAIRQMAHDQRVRGDRLAVLGWSQGGLVAATVAGRSEATVKACVLWAAVSTPKLARAFLLGPANLAKGLPTDGSLITIQNGGKTIALKRGFFDAMDTANPMQEIAAYQGPLFIAHGRQDAAVPIAAAALYAAAHKGLHQLWITDMDHSFNASQGPEMLDKLVAATVAFLNANLP